MQIEIINKDEIRIKDKLDTYFDLFVLYGGGIQVVSSWNNDLEIEDRLPLSVIIREKDK